MWIIVISLYRKLTYLVDPLSRKKCENLQIFFRPDSSHSDHLILPVCLNRQVGSGVQNLLLTRRLPTGSHVNV